MKDIIFLSAEQVCKIQSATLPKAPSSNIGLIEGAVDRVFNAYQYNNTTDIFHLAALYLIAIAKAHAFPDANKRTAYQASLIFLELNGVQIQEDAYLVDITVKAAEGTVDIEEIVETFREHTV